LKSMRRLLSTFVLPAILAALLAACGFARTLHAATAPTVTDFASQLNLIKFGQLAVHTEGRVKSLDSHTRAAMQYVSGAHKIQGRSTTFTYLDLMLRPQEYADADVIYLKNKTMRAQVAQVLREGMRADAEAIDDSTARQELENRITMANQRLDTFVQTGLISPRMLADPRVRDLLGRLSTDLLRSAKFVDMIQQAMGVMDAASLRANLKLVPPPGGGFEDRWLTLDDLSNPRSLLPNADAMDPQLRASIVAQWSAFTKGWTELNASAVNDAAAQLATLLPQINPAIYPSQDRLSWESWYFRMHNLTWVWTFYGLAMIPLLLAIVFRWPAARVIGMFLFLFAFGWHTFAVMLRWYVSERWPNSNMFEAVTTAAWFGGCLATVLEIFVVRRSPMRNLFALGSAAASAAALMAAHFLPLQLNPNISNMMPVLNDVWLYIHTNVIIFSYCLIFMAAVIATVYLIYRGVAALAGWQNAKAFARAGGGGSLILTRPDGSSVIDAKRSTFGQVLDGTTMVVMEMSFILLWTGLCMGAIWADHSWGRPWGWDPKEVFALNTFLVFLVLVHVRMKVKDKGLWTALLAVVGAGVMLFNWIIINFAISGLHSYA
jgi:cytochrome c-type biogenesis protein CcsB